MGVKALKPLLCDNARSKKKSLYKPNEVGDIHSNGVKGSLMEAT